MTSLVAVLTLGQILFAPDAGRGQYIKTLKCVGAGSSCSVSGTVGTITVSSDGGPGAVPGGAPPQVQFNNWGSFGGADNVWIDGGNLGVNDMVAFHPTAPTGADQSIIYDWLAQSGMPAQPMTMDNGMAIPMPIGVTAPLSLIGTAANWRATCCIPQGFTSTGIQVLGNTGNGTCQTSGNASSPSWTTASLYSMSPNWIATTTSSATNLWAGMLYGGTASVHFWRGNTANRGGFIWYARFGFDVVNNTTGAHRVFAGIIANNSGFSTNTKNPSFFQNTAYFGADNWVANLGICSASGSGYATCSDLGAGFPITAGAFYDMYLWAKPNDTAIGYGIVRLDSPAAAHGSLTSSLPGNSVQFTWEAVIGSGATACNDGGTGPSCGGTSDGGTYASSVMEVCTVWNY